MLLGVYPHEYMMSMSTMIRDSIKLHCHRKKGLSDNRRHHRRQRRFWNKILRQVWLSICGEQYVITGSCSHTFLQQLHQNIWTWPSLLSLSTRIKIASTSEEDRSKNGIVDVDVEILLMVKKNIRGQMYHIYIQKQIISNWKIMTQTKNLFISCIGRWTISMDG